MHCSSSYLCPQITQYHLCYSAMADALAGAGILAEMQKEGSTRIWGLFAEIRKITRTLPHSKAPFEEHQNLTYEDAHGMPSPESLA